MLLASKYLDKFPIKIGLLTATIAKDQYTAEEIKEKEREMLRAIQFDLTFPTIQDFIDQFFMKFIQKHYRGLNKNEWKVIERIKDQCIFKAMMMSYQYEALQYK